MKRTPVLLVSRDYPPPVTNGMARYAQRLAEGLGGCLGEVVVLAGPGPSAARSTTADVRVERKKIVSGLKHSPGRWRTFAQVLERLVRLHGIRCVLIQHPYHGEGALEVRRRTGCSVVYVCHTCAATDRVLRRDDPRYSVDPQNEARERAIVVASDAVVCVSDSLRRVVCEQYPVAPDKVTVIPTGVPLADGAPRRASGLDPRLAPLRAARRRGSLIALYIGRDSWEKGTDLLPHIIDGLTSRRADVILAMVGVSRQRWANLMLRDISYPLPWLEAAAMEELYSLGHVLVIPSRRDSMPYVLLESMARGIVPVVRDVDGPGELVHHGTNGLKVDSAPTAAAEASLGERLADAILRLGEEPATRERLAERAVETMTEHHSLDGQMRGYACLISRLSTASIISDSR